MALNQGPTLRSRMALWSAPQISVNALKIAGIVLMTMYFFSLTVVQRGLLPIADYTAEELNELLSADPQAMLWAGVGSVMSVIGIMSLPIFAYLLVQGVEHTASIQRYILTVLVFAVISEVPYDLATSGQVWDWSSQNSLWTVFVALVMLWLMHTFQGKGMLPVVLDILIAAAGCFWAILLNALFGGGFVLIVAILYLLRERKAAGCLLGVLVSLLYTSAPLGFIPVAMSSGRRRPWKLWAKYACYAFYPVMLGVFALITYLVA